jgi:hypothetical protein
MTRPPMLHISSVSRARGTGDHPVLALWFIVVMHHQTYLQDG